MKKSLLVLFVALSASFAQAQTCASAIGTTGFADQFNSLISVGDSVSGIYWWGDSLLAGDENPNFRALMVRDSVNSELDITVTQAEGEYIPFGVSFGDSNGDGTGVPVTVDLSGDASFTFDVTNRSTEGIKVAFALLDVNDKLVNTNSTVVDFATAWQHEISLVVEASQTSTFSGDFTGGFYANYDNSQLESDFDFTQVKSVSITITNALNTGDPDYLPLLLTDAEVALSNFHVGACPAVGIEEELSKRISTYPNPSNGMVTIDYHNALRGSVDAYVIDAFGQQVAQGKGSNGTVKLDLSQETTGAYMVKLVSSDNTSTISKLLIN